MDARHTHPHSIDAENFYKYKIIISLHKTHGIVLYMHLDKYHPTHPHRTRTHIAPI